MTTTADGTARAAAQLREAARNVALVAERRAAQYEATGNRAHEATAGTLLGSFRATWWREIIAAAVFLPEAGRERPTARPAALALAFGQLGRDEARQTLGAHVQKLCRTAGKSEPQAWSAYCSATVQITRSECDSFVTGAADRP
jgi:hypothetical protein